jgi:hypothetical protein
MPRFPKAALSLLVAAICWLDHSAVLAQAEKTFAVIVHVATIDSSDLDARIATLFGTANTHFADAGIEFAVEERRQLPESFAVLENIRERRRLARFFVPKTINVFLVDEILDPVPSEATRKAAKAQGRKPSGRLSGAHIPIKGRKPDTYIIIARTRSSYSLAHELGHFFGVAHSKAPQNIMSYGARRDRFESNQIEVFRKRGRRFQRKRWLRIVTRAPASPEGSLAIAWQTVSRLSYAVAPHRGPRL